MLNKTTTVTMKSAESVRIWNSMKWT